MNMLKKTANFQGLSGAAGWVKFFGLAFVSASFAASMVSCKNAAKDSKLKSKPALTPETSEFGVTYDPEGTFTFTGLDLVDVKDDAALKDGKDIMVTVENTGEWAKKSGSEDWLMNNHTGLPILETTELTATVIVEEAGGKDVLVLSFTQAKELVDALTYVGGEPTTLPDWAAKTYKTEKFKTHKAQLALKWAPDVSVVWNGEALGYFMSLLSAVADDGWQNPFDGDGDKAALEASVKELVSTLAAG